MKRIIPILVTILPFLIFTTPAFAVTTPQEITNYTSSTLNLIVAIASAASLFFLIKGGYLYMTSSGKPDSLESAKRTIKNAVIGLVLVLASGLIVGLFTSSLSAGNTGTNTAAINITPLQPVQPPGGLTVVLTDAISGLFQLLLVSAAVPIMNAVVSFLTTTPTLLNNSVIMNFWLIMLAITDSLFVLVVALLGLHFMSAEALGFEQVELKHLLPRLGLAFLGANISLFLADYVIITCNALVNAVLNSTGGLSQALLSDAINPVTTITGTTPFISIIFFLMFLIIAIVLLFMYIGRLIFISLGAVLSPFIFLMWSLPKFSDFAEIAVKTYLVTVFTIFVHVVVIQLASAFITLPSQTPNSIVTVAVGIGLFLALLKIPQTLMQLVFYTTGFRSLSRIGSSLVNVMTTDKSSSRHGDFIVMGDGTTKRVRKVASPRS